MSPTAAQIREAADRLLAAEVEPRQCAPIREIIGDKDIPAAYAVQNLITADSLARGRVIVGHKIGLTSPAVQQQLGVDQPDSGVLFADMRIANGGTADTAKLLQPKVEAEIAFILSADLDEDISDEAVRRAAGTAYPAIEIVDSRIQDWKIGIVDTVADNGSSALFVLGDSSVPADGFDFVSPTMRLTEDGAEVSQGNGAACLGSPLIALQWLARTSRDNGAPLRAGHIVLSGALGPMVAAKAGSTYRTTIQGIGSVEVTFA